jgi:YidC/Oxa1 family membrane protein insertase
MEKRLLVAIVLSFLVILLWQTLFIKKPTPEESFPPETAEIGVTPEETIQTPAPTPPESPLTEESIEPISESSQEEIHIDTSLYHAIWSNKGAVLKSWTLKEHRDENNEPIELISPQSQESSTFPFSLRMDDAGFDDLANSSLYSYSTSGMNLNAGETRELRFEFADENGNRIEKTFVFKDGEYAFDIEVNVWKSGLRLEPRIAWGPSFGRLSPAELKNRFSARSGVAVYSAAKVERRDEFKYDPAKGNAFNFVQWAAYENNYFTALFVSDPQKSSAVFILEGTAESPSFFLAVSHVQKAFLGPKQLDILEDWGHESKKVVRFGLFGFIAEILYKAIKIIHQAFPNWGISIIILTIIIKIIFFPLTYSSTKSMAKMQEIQPKIKALRAKYKKSKSDMAQRRKMNEEMMKLYKEHGINPAGGCLPILIQLPIFWGFFRLLVVSLEFRQSPFVFWIKDLSMKDPLYITPILMGMTQYISQKMTPTSADPTQQRMMLIMPVVMTIFFMNFQSGLVLYWLTNNVLQIGQQYIMNRLMKRKKRELNGKKGRKK